MYRQSRSDDLERILDLEARLGSVEEAHYRALVRAQSAEQQLANLTWQRDNWQRLYHNHLWHSDAAHEATLSCELMPSACNRSHLVDDGEHLSFLEWKVRHGRSLEDF